MAGLCLPRAEQLASLHGTLEVSAKNRCVWFLQKVSVWFLFGASVPRLLRPILLGGPSTRLESGKVWVGAGYHLPVQDADPINFSGRKKASGSLMHLQITRSK